MLNILKVILIETVHECKMPADVNAAFHRRQVSSF